MWCAAHVHTVTKPLGTTYITILGKRVLMGLAHARNPARQVKGSKVELRGHPLDVFACSDAQCMNREREGSLPIMLGMDTSK